MTTKHFLTHAQLDSLTSPMRLAIVQRLEIDKRATARELAHTLGRPVTALYHHLKRLDDIGLVRVVEKRGAARRPEAVYALVADYLSSAEVVKTRKGVASYSRTAARVADAGARAVKAAAVRGIATFAGDQRNTRVKYYLLRADRKKIAGLNRLLNDIDATATQSDEDGEEIQVTILMSPLVQKR